MQDKYKGEKVLVFNRSILDELGSFDGTNTDTARYMNAILNTSNNHFHERFRAEEDTSLKQIIPYIIFCCEDMVFSYVRGKKAGEKRLVGNRSIGIGGHVNPVDKVENSSESSDMPTYMEAVRREISEEVIVEEDYNPRIAALLNDDSNAVGKVHFGIIHICRLSKQSVRKREQQITESGFVKISQLAGPRRNELESWSQYAIDFLAKQ